jgi:hypothetical protein
MPRRRLPGALVVPPRLVPRLGALLMRAPVEGADTAPLVMIAPVLVAVAALRRMSTSQQARSRDALLGGGEALPLRATCGTLQPACPAQPQAA